MKRSEKNKTGRPKEEVLGFILILLSVLVFISLFSYAIGKNTKKTNWGGPTGLFIGALLFQTFGLFSFLFVFLLFLWGINFFFKKRPRFSLKLSVILFIFAFLLNALFGYLVPTSPIVGLSGRFLGEGFHHLFGKVGSLIVLFGSLILLLLIFIPTATKFIFGGLTFVFYRLLLLILWFAKFTFRGLLALHSLIKKKAKTSTKRTGKESNTHQLATQPKTAKETEEAVPPEVVPKEETEEVVFSETAFQKEFISLLKEETEGIETKDERELKEEAEILSNKLREFAIDGKISNILTGPVITRFEFEPAPGIKIQRIESLSDDLALSLKAERIRILAPIPGKSAVGIEIPNKKRRIVSLRKQLEKGILNATTSSLAFVLGETITGEPYFADLRQMPHILIAGTTGSGKSVCINCILSSIIYRASYHDVRFLTIDPKQLELPIYDPIPHLLGPTTTDPQSAQKELDRLLQVMEIRYGEFARLGVRDIESYNARCKEIGKPKKPYIVIVIDELADLMKTTRTPEEMERKITRLAQMSRAVGIHLILATQRPSVDVITGLIKANFPCRIAFQVASKTDSRTILDMNGAESLLGMGDMLYLPPGKGEPLRLHGAFVSAEETKGLVNLWARRYLKELLKDLVPNPEKKARELITSNALDILINKEKTAIKEEQKRLADILGEEVAEKILAIDYHSPLSEERDLLKYKEPVIDWEQERDEYFFEAARLVFQTKEASVSMLQRKLDVGWARAGRIIDQLERAGIVGPYVGSKSRRVLVETEEELQAILRRLQK